MLANLVMLAFMSAATSCSATIQVTRLGQQPWLNAWAANRH
ncbi:unnamed protein product [marine sediment metagenome]|uniref:Uncharacterized protein n=1 Tax=marine sediment metagenome TaxID=412755 RepID=X1DFJ5_9ZZZZ